MVSSSSLKSRVMSPGVSCRPVTAGAQVLFQATECGICGGLSGTGTGLFSQYFVFTLSVSLRQCSINTHYFYDIN
jgi:hypothetical protein